MKASRLGHFIGLFLVFCSLGLSVFGQAEDDVVINEITVNPATGWEYVELLVVNPAGVNMQGWTLSDVGSRAGTTTTTEGDITLPASASYLSLVPAGTYVVVVLTTPTANSNTLTEDTSLVDGNTKLVLLAGSTTGMVAAGTMDMSTNENVHVYAGTRAAGTLIDQVCMGTNTSYITGTTWGDNNGATAADNINGGTAIPSGSAVAFTPPNLTFVEASNNDTGTRFTVIATSYGTPGTSNISTAAGVFISGRVAMADGRGITNAVVTITGNALAVPRNVITGRRGTYTFDDLEPGETYIVTVRARRFMFSNPSQVISIVDNVTDADFIADGGTARAVEPTRKVAVTVRSKW